MSILLSGAAQGATGGSSFMIFIVIALVAMVYFVMIRPNSKQKKKEQDMLNNIARGDAVVTNSGFYGVVIDVTDQDVIVEFGNNRNCRIPMQKKAIIQVEKPVQATAEEDPNAKKGKKK